MAGGYCAMHQALRRQSGRAALTGSRVERLASRASVATDAVLFLGAPCSGKTWVRTRVAEVLGWPTWSIDEARAAITRPGRWWPDDDAQAWANLGAWCDQNNPCAVEVGVGAPSALVIMRGRRLFRVVCFARDSIRYDRLAARVREGHGGTRMMPGYIGKMFAAGAGPFSGGDLTIDTSDGGSAMVDECVAAIRSWRGV